MKTPKTSKMMAALMALFGLAASCKAVDYHVVTAQDLQNALTLAAASSVSNNIYVTNGYYTGNFNYNSSNVNQLTLLAEPGVLNTQIIIDSGGTGSSLSITATASPNITVRGITFLRNCGNSSVSGLTIAAGNTEILVSGSQFLSPTNSTGVGLKITSDLNITVANCTVTGNSAATGISIYSAGNAVTLQNCAITGNTGGAVISGPSAIVVTGSVFSGNSSGFFAIPANTVFGGLGCSGTIITLANNSFIGNSAVTDGGFFGGGGGGATCFGNMILSNNTFTSNSAEGPGGGAFCGGGTVTLVGNSFMGNSAYISIYDDSINWGGGVYGYGTLILSNNIFTGNSVGGGAGKSGYGGGAYFNGGSIAVSGNTFTSNLAYGGIAGYGGGADFSGTLMLSNNTFAANSAISGNGGGANCSGAMTELGDTFQQNTAQSGGGLYASGPTITLADNLAIQNSGDTTSSQGGGIWVDASATLNMINNTVTGNTSAGSGGGVAYIVTGTVELLNIYNNIIWGNSATVSGGDVYLSGTGQKKVFDYNDVDSIYGVFDIAQTNIDLSPQFFNPVSGDHHIQSTSPCIGAGTTNAPSLPPTDLDGNPRVLNGLVDMGCYEFTTNVFHPADLAGAWTITPAEFTAYAAAWKSGQIWTNAPNPIPANYLTRAGYLMTNGGAYYNDGSARPTNWKTNQ